MGEENGTKERLQSMVNKQPENPKKKTSFWQREDARAKSIKQTRDLLDRVYTSPFVHMLMNAMADAGCPVNPNTHIAVEECNSGLFGAFDPYNNQIVLCHNQFAKMHTDKGKKLAMTHLLTHELVHAFDYCRADIDVNHNPRHLMCTEIRAAALSGQCMLKYHKLNATMAGLKDYHKRCVRDSARQSFSTLHPEWSSSNVWSLLMEVFPSCYRDYEPFDRLPLTVKQAELSLKAYQTRHRYNIAE